MEQQLASASLTVQMPSAATFSLLSPLHPLLSQLQSLYETSATEITDTTSPVVNANQSISNIKDFSHAAIATVGSKIQNARQAVKRMDGLSLTLEEQEDIIRVLESEVSRRNATLRTIQASAVSLTKIRLEAEAMDITAA